MQRGVNVLCNPLKPCFYIWQVNIFMQLGKIGDTQKPTNKQTQHILKLVIVQNKWDPKRDATKKGNCSKLGQSTGKWDCFDQFFLCFIFCSKVCEEVGEGSHWFPISAFLPSPYFAFAIPCFLLCFTIPYFILFVILYHVIPYFILLALNILYHSSKYEVHIIPVNVLYHTSYLPFLSPKSPLSCHGATRYIKATLWPHLSTSAHFCIDEKPKS